MPDPFGMHGHFVARSGQGDALAELLLEAAAALERDPACRLYLVSRDPEEHDRVWVTELWADARAHGASLEDEATRALIARARPLIADMGGASRFRPVGGKGLDPLDPTPDEGRRRSPRG